jgi:hypothetical protein
LDSQVLRNSKNSSKQYILRCVFRKWECPQQVGDKPPPKLKPCCYRLTTDRESHSQQNGVRPYREAIMTHASCNHADIVKFVERNADFCTIIGPPCQSLLGEEQGSEGWAGGGRPRSSSDRSQQTSTFSEDRALGCSSISPYLTA